jgi:hypothetical protein
MDLDLAAPQMRQEIQADCSTGLRVHPQILDRGVRVVTFRDTEIIHALSGNIGCKHSRIGWPTSDMRA